jgi:multicomponent Na+:H+ antiporter subunit F
VTGFTLAVAVFLLLTLMGGMVRVVRGPAAADRMLAAQLFGTTGVAILLLLAHAGTATALIDVALVFALLAAVVGVTFVSRGMASWPSSEEEFHERG